MVWSFMQPLTAGMSYTLQLISLWARASTISVSTLIHACCYIIFLKLSPVPPWHSIWPVCNCQLIRHMRGKTSDVMYLQADICLSGLHGSLYWWIVCGLTGCTLVFHSFNIQHTAKLCVIYWAHLYTSVYLSSALVVCLLLYRLLKCLEKSP